MHPKQTLYVEVMGFSSAGPIADSKFDADSELEMISSPNPNWEGSRAAVLKLRGKTTPLASHEEERKPYIFRGSPPL